MLPLSNISVPSNIKKCSVLDFAHADDVSVLDVFELEFDKLYGISSRDCSDINFLLLHFKNVVQHCISNFVPSKTKKANLSILGYHVIRYI